MSFDGSSTISAGGIAQDLFGGAPPNSGYAIYNLDQNVDLWINDSGSALQNGVGSVRVPAGGYYETPQGYGSNGGIGVVSIFSVSTGHKFTAKRW